MGGSSIYGKNAIRPCQKVNEPLKIISDNNRKLAR